jgi:5-methylcytosine-specific restriction endonuclease McrA
MPLSFKPGQEIPKSCAVSVCQCCGEKFRHYKKSAGKYCSIECRLKMTCLTDQQKDLIRSYRGDGKSYNYISNEIGRSRQSIATFCANEGIAVVPHPNHVEANRRTAEDKRQCRAIRPVFVCLHCGCAYTHKRSDNLGFLFCSKHCADNYCYPVETIELKDIPEGRRGLPRCEICGDVVRRFGACCSEECRREKDRRHYSENKADIARVERHRYREEKGISIRHVECDICGRMFETWRPKRKCCSKECSDKAAYEQSLPAKRDSGRRRRARLKGATVEVFSSKEIFMRDGWRCQICKRKIKKNAKHPHPYAPTLDHIVPLSRGGTHERKNVQLACSRCNSKKGAGVADGCDQLRMF